MKSIFSLFLIISYLSGSLGVKMNQHFCCGELVETEIVTQLSQDLLDTENAGEDPSSGCCSNTVVTLKVDDGKTVFHAFTSEKAFSPLAVIPNWSASILPFLLRIPPLSDSDKAPPDIPKPPLFLIFRSLLI